MKKTISIILSLIMLVSCIGSFEITALANTIETPRSLSIDGSWTDDQYKTETENEIWYQFTIPSDGQVVLKFMTYVHTHLDLYNYDKTKTIIEAACSYGSPSSPETNTSVVDLSAGTYKVLISNETGKFKLSCAFTSYNTNDSGANTYDSPLDVAQNYTITGAITATDKEDWYRIYVPLTGSYIFKLTTYTHSHLYLFNSDLSKTILDTVCLYGKSSEPATNSKICVLTAGTYYIKIDNDSGRYLFNWAALTPENCTHEFEESTVAPTCFEQGYKKHTCKLCGYSYNDNFMPAAHYYTTKTVYPTYTSNGYTLHVCSVCGTSYATDTVAKLSVQKPKIHSVKKGKKKLTLYFTNYYNLSGIQVQYSTSKKFTKKTTKKVTTTKSSKVLKKLKKNKKYYIRVRGYIYSDNKKVYSSWSKTKTVKTK